MMPEDEALVSSSQRQELAGLVDKTVKLYQSCNQLFQRSNACHLCHVYVDKQVEFESHQQDFSSPLERVWMQTRTADPSPLEVELYRQFLFDEESVVETISDREEDKGRKETGHAKTHEDEQTTVTQRTH